MPEIRAVAAIVAALCRCAWQRAAAGCVQQHCRVEVEACRSTAGLHPSCSLRLRPHPRRGLAAKWAAAETRRTLHRPQACCCCCRLLQPRLLHHAAAAAALRCCCCCTLLHARVHSPHCSTGKFWVTAASVRLRSARKALQPPRGSHSSSASTFGQLSILVVWREDLALSGNNLCLISFCSTLHF